MHTANRRGGKKQRQELKQKRDQEFEEKYGTLDPNDLIKVGVMYRDATTYYYHKESDTLFGQEFHSTKFKHKGKPNDYAREFVDRALSKQ